MALLRACVWLACLLCAAQLASAKNGATLSKLYDTEWTGYARTSLAEAHCRAQVHMRFLAHAVDASGTDSGLVALLQWEYGGSNFGSTKSLANPVAARVVRPGRLNKANGVVERYMYLRPLDDNELADVALLVKGTELLSLRSETCVLWRYTPAKNGKAEQLSLSLALLMPNEAEPGTQSTILPSCTKANFNALDTPKLVPVPPGSPPGTQPTTKARPVRPVCTADQRREPIRFLELEPPQKERAGKPLHTLIWLTKTGASAHMLRPSWVAPLLIVAVLGVLACAVCVYLSRTRMRLRSYDYASMQMRDEALELEDSGYQAGAYSSNGTTGGTGGSRTPSLHAVEEGSGPEEE